MAHRLRLPKDGRIDLSYHLRLYSRIRTGDVDFGVKIEPARDPESYRVSYRNRITFRNSPTKYDWGRDMDSENSTTKWRDRVNRIRVKI